jgi:DNA invertase Pin-like site-specific DNA recombinase
LRLSRDDGGDFESNSIGNQRDMLQKYASESGFSPVSEYVDDGISGTTFERAGFKRMITDIEDGKISIVICKDLSRLGRNNALVAFYTEIFFIEKRVRFIALNDGIDTAFGDNEIMPFKSVLNEYYARDLSKKVRSAYRSQAIKGNYTGASPPFGYLKSPENKHLLIPNPDTAPIVQKMFRMAVSGMGTAKIARILREEEILTPRSYAQKVLGINRPKTYKDETDWADTSVRVIISNKVYLGHMVSQKSKPTSFKNRRPIKLPEEEYVVVNNTHEPLVTEDEFEIAQKVIRKKQRWNKHEFVNIFSGLLKCNDCGSGLVLHAPVRNGIVHNSYVCNRYRQRSKYCTTHYIRYDDIYNMVLESIQEKQQFVKAHQNELAVYAQKLASRGADIELKKMRLDLDKSTRRDGELDILIQKLFEQVALGSLSQERFDTLIATYEDEQKTIKTKIDTLQKTVSIRCGDADNIMRFFNLVQKHEDVTELTAEILHSFIENIVVHQAEGGKILNRTQKVVINFRFIRDNWINFLH